MPKQKKERIFFDISDSRGRVYAEIDGHGADSGNVTNLLLLAILRELERSSKPRGKK